MATRWKSVSLMCPGCLPVALLLLGAGCKVWQHMVHNERRPPLAGSSQVWTGTPAWTVPLSELFTLAAMLLVAWKATNPASTTQAPVNKQQLDEAIPVMLTNHKNTMIKTCKAFMTLQPGTEKRRSEVFTGSWSMSSQPEIAAPIKRGRTCDGADTTLVAKSDLLVLDKATSERLSTLIADVISTQEAESVSDNILRHGQVQVMVADEQHSLNQKVLKTMLPAYECEVLTMASAHLVLDHLSTCSKPPDIILLSLTMPGDPILDIITVIRSKWSSSTLPIILLADADDDHVVGEGLNAGANDYVIRPCRLQELSCRLHTHLALRKAINVAEEAGRNLSLLRSILPASIISKLKRGNQLVAEHHEQVTILFTDIKGFTTMAQEWPTERIILMLNEMFTAFDHLCTAHDVYKVETIGDAYMVVSGHDGKQDHAVRMMNMASAMVKAVQHMTRWDGKTPEIRVGVHTGPAHSGVVGVLRPHYSFFGDTVNTASRMESNGFPMAVHVSEPTRAAVEEWQAYTGQGHHTFVECGPRSVKGKGIMHTHLLKVGRWQEALQMLVAEKQAQRGSSVSSLGTTSAAGVFHTYTNYIYNGPEGGSLATAPFLHSPSPEHLDSGSAVNSSITSTPVSVAAGLRRQQHLSTEGQLNTHLVSTCSSLDTPPKQQTLRRASAVQRVGNDASGNMSDAVQGMAGDGLAPALCEVHMPAWPACNDRVPFPGKPPSLVSNLSELATEVSSIGTSYDWVFSDSNAAAHAQHTLPQLTTLLPAQRHRLKRSSTSSVMDVPSNLVTRSPAELAAVAAGALANQGPSSKPAPRKSFSERNLRAVGSTLEPAISVAQPHTHTRTLRRVVTERQLRAPTRQYAPRNAQTMNAVPTSPLDSTSTTAGQRMQSPCVATLKRAATLTRPDTELLLLLESLRTVSGSDNHGL